MKRIILSALLTLAVGTAWAQKDERPFRAYLINNIYDVYLRINLYEQNITIRGQELYGELPGYLGKKNNSFCWPVTSCRVKNDSEAELQLVNDFGSEDVKVTLTRKNDSVYSLKQVSGGVIKVPNKGKWMKLPKTLEFIKR